MKRRAVLLVLALVVVCALAAAPPAPTATAAPPRPNVVLITVDDMRLDDLAVMPRTRELLGQLELTEFLSNHPVCCPARAQLLTGQLAQHNGVHHNDAATPWAGYKALRAKNTTFARWFQDAGYSTALVGKFMNGWKPRTSARPAGWSQFMPLVKNAYSPYLYSYLSGSAVKPAPEGLHTNDFVTSRTEARIKAAEGRDSQPFLIWSSYVAPHHMTVYPGGFGPPVPAERHRGDLAGVVPTSEAKPSYEEPTDRAQARAAYEDASSAPTAGQRARATEPSLREFNQARLESLLSVDEGVGRIVDALARRGELERTIIVFTSDNGFLLGEHGQMGKNSYYEESLRVPFLAAGPGVASGSSAKGSMMVDVAPSLAALARVPVKRAVDGRTDLFSAGGGWGDDIGTLIQAGSAESPWIWRGTRTSRWTYVETLDAGTLLFDRTADPFQLDNLAGTGEPAEQDLARLTPGLDED
ncbi:sulfatase-like hydrolase/transferase [Nocardioides sp. HDW12B]|uniref:sulfatase-like hydrolase/transferase n=1 Tax=Nocardioides sp. HDW12B TaxID=2714939 RepID=UPI00140C2F23|nr:sulfatase-like hydrolase/transferase [Nocardioides sp. HDW12B]QIK66494.1 sulfatase-like hydrolase/transferase [Nocardioides sp. HDW12B]